MKTPRPPSHRKTASGWTMEVNRRWGWRWIIDTDHEIATMNLVLLPSFTIAKSFTFFYECLSWMNINMSESHVWMWTAYNAFYIYIYIYIYIFGCSYLVKSLSFCQRELSCRKWEWSRHRLHPLFYFACHCSCAKVHFFQDFVLN